MNEAAQERLKNPPPRPYPGWTFAAAAVCGVVARLIYVTDGPRPLGIGFIAIAVVLATVSLVLKLRRWWKSPAGRKQSGK